LIMKMVKTSNFYSSRDDLHTPKQAIQCKQRTPTETTDTCTSYAQRIIHSDGETHMSNARFMLQRVNPSTSLIQAQTTDVVRYQPMRSPTD
jgi:hypothetical protein